MQLKKTSAVFIALALCAVMLFGGCGDKGNNNASTTVRTTVPTSDTTRAPTPSSTDDMLDGENGKISDTSERGDNGAVGDAVSDVSRAVSDAGRDVESDVR